MDEAQIREALDSALLGEAEMKAYEKHWERFPDPQ
jgi:hypothetical protein